MTGAAWSEEVVELLSERLALLSQPTRIRMLQLLGEHDELTVRGLASRLDLPIQTASDHLLRLAGAGVLVRRPVGREVRYALADPRVLSVYRSALSTMLARPLSPAVHGGSPDARSAA